MNLAGKSVLVTGGARRVGRAIVLAFAERGAHVAIHYNQSANRAGEVAEEARAAGVDVAVFGADLSHPEEIEVLARTVVERFGGLDVLVNSAAVFERTPLGSISPEDCDRHYQLNARAPLLLSQALAPALTRAQGVIVNVTDVGGERPWPGYLPYGASKAALIYLTRGLAKALAPAVRVNAVAPGTVLPPESYDSEAQRVEAGRSLVGVLGAPEDVARAVVFACESDFMTGEEITMDGGKRWR